MKIASFVKTIVTVGIVAIFMGGAAIAELPSKVTISKLKYDITTGLLQGTAKAVGTGKCTFRWFGQISNGQTLQGSKKKFFISAATSADSISISADSLRGVEDPDTSIESDDPQLNVQVRATCVEGSKTRVRTSAPKAVFVLCGESQETWTQAQFMSKLQLRTKSVSQ